ncbi:hypothetical protein SAMN05661096_01909 [Marivirga sericea]|uniref:Uncharacterized protein n=1 Tax=Marivirga sericea TaxID=1028 RepID=A0A1X7JPA5_9BACT|nr:hypothetical protein [Marivirga sericea]SMG29834.1 hypothetical protein SAMN05661096_01909 [Marivirga sericea]
MSSDNGTAVLYFDIHFKLVNKPDEIINFLEDFENSEINRSDFLGKIKFQSLIDIIGRSNHLKGKVDAFQLELNSMFDEIKVEICRRLRVMIAFDKQTRLFKADWQKIKVFESLLIDLKQQGMFDMIKDFIEGNQLSLGKRFSFEEKYKPFTPKLDDKSAKNHFKAEFRSRNNSTLPKYIIWLNNLEQEKAFPKSGKTEHNYSKSTHELPQELIFEKIAPKIIAANTFSFNVNSNDSVSFEEIFNLDNYYLEIVDENKI